MSTFSARTAVARTASLVIVSSLMLGGALTLGPTAPAHAGPTTLTTTSQDDGRAEFVVEPLELAPLPGVGGVEALPLEWPSGTTVTYQWSVDGELIDWVTGPTFLFDQPWYGDKDLTLTVSASHPEYQPASFTSAPWHIADSDIQLRRTLSSSIPAITGLQDGHPPQVHQQLSVATANWTEGTRFSFQWLADGKPITGATKRDFTVTSAQAGAKLSVEVLGVKVDYLPRNHVSAETASVPTSVTPRVTLPTSATVGTTLKAETGSWPGWKAREFFWKVDGVVDSEVDFSSDEYVLSDRHVGHEISLTTVWFYFGDSEGTFDQVGVDSITTTKVAGLVEQTGGSVAVAGTPVVGKTIVAETAGWAKGTKLSYEWLADGEVIPGQTEDRIKPPRDTTGKRITVKVTGVLAGHTDRTVESDPSEAVSLPAMPKATVSVTGTEHVGSTLTATSHGWPEGTKLTYKWEVSTRPDGHGYVTIPGATGPSLTLTSDLIDQNVIVSVKGTHPDYISGSASGNSDGPVLPEAQTPGKTTVTGTLRVGETITAVPQGWVPDTRYEYVWAAGHSANLHWLEGDGGPRLTITPDLAGKDIGLLVIGARDGYPEKRLSSVHGTVAPGVLDAPVPDIAGTPTVGHTLSAMPEQWTKGTKLTYQWYADGVALDNEIFAKLSVSPEHVGKEITVTVTGVLDGYTSAEQTSAATTPVKAGTMTGPTPGLSGSSRIGKTIIATLGTWPEGTTLSYQWKANGVAIKGATKSSMSVTPSLKGKRLAVTVTGERAGFETVSHTSRVSKPVASGVLSTSTPKVSGTAKVGQKLTAKTGTWTKGTKLSYQWKANGKSIKGATKSTYTPAASTVGEPITVTVTGSKSGYSTVSKTSKATSKVTRATLKSPTPKVSGSARVGSKLTAKAGSWTSGTKLSYQWYANGKPIKGATKSSLVLKSAHKGKAITVKVKAAKSGYIAVLKTSGKTAKVLSRR
ncbi:hypothetical protein [Brachybacterium sp.]|uniref:hypothetical protein n=1 Tax=Brachybacterium sp. TaxID=1891286 RepID=UPI002ED68866